MRIHTASLDAIDSVVPFFYLMSRFLFAVTFFIRCHATAAAPLERLHSKHVSLILERFSTTKFVVLRSTFS